MAVVIFFIVRRFFFDMKLTKNFRKSEFDSKDGAEMPQTVLSNVKRLAKNLQALRDHVGKPISINSGYRSPEHNAKIGGVPNSAHILGMAADIKIEGLTPSQVKAAILELIQLGKMHNGGIGLYSTFVHYDTRANAARW